MLDFHQALSSHRRLPPLQRELGLVFDLELPLDFVADQPHRAGRARHHRRRHPVGCGHPDVGAAHPYVVRARADRRRDGCSASPRGDARSPDGRCCSACSTSTTGSFGVAQVDVDGALHKTMMHATNTTAAARVVDPPPPPTSSTRPRPVRRCARAASPCSPTPGRWRCWTPSTGPGTTTPTSSRASPRSRRSAPRT